jgi:NTE family protein
MVLKPPRSRSLPAHPAEPPSASSSSSHSTPLATAPRGDTAVVLAGAVAQGAFAAGAIEALARHRVPITRIVATSSGALSGTLLAAGVRAGRVADAADTLAELWRDDAKWCNALDPSARNIVRGRGLSTSDKVRRIVRDAVEPFVPGCEPIDLRLVLTALAGDPNVRHDKGATSFESVLRFADDDFDHAAARDRLYTATVAAAAFPGLYAPIDVPGLGACVDGGAVNDAPIGHALDGNNLSRVVVITNAPKVVNPPPLHGVALAEHLAQVLIDERLYRDLRSAHTVNRQLAALERLASQGCLSAATLAQVKNALGWPHRRRLELVEIRPRTALRGGAFTALGDRALRAEYIAEGRRAAEEALARASHADHVCAVSTADASIAP